MGPGGDELENALHALADGELGAGERLALLERLKGEPRLRARLNELMFLKACMREAFAHLPAPGMQKVSISAVGRGGRPATAISDAPRKLCRGRDAKPLEATLAVATNVSELPPVGPTDDRRLQVPPL